MIPPTKVTIEHFPFAEDDYLRKFFLIHASNSWQSKFSKKCYLIWFRSVFKLLILSHHQLDFPHQNFNRKHSTCRRVFNSNFIAFLHQFPDSPKLPKKRCVFNFSRYSNSYFTKTTGFISSIRVGIQEILVVDRFSMGEFSVHVLCISVLTLRLFQEMLLFLFISFFKLAFVSRYNFEFFHHELS